MPVRCYGLILNNYFLDYVKFHYRNNINDDIGPHLHYFFRPKHLQESLSKMMAHLIMLLYSIQCMYQQ
jgi:hypothetical protein